MTRGPHTASGGPASEGLFIANTSRPGAAGAWLEIVSPHDGTVVAQVAEARQADVDAAVDAARDALPDWRRTAPAARGALLAAWADLMERDAQELALLECLDAGHPLRDARALDVPRAVAVIRYFAGIADKIEGSVVPVDPDHLVYAVREPIGVVGQIIPWNQPLLLAATKLAPALAAGNTVVLKPAEWTPRSALWLGRLAAEAGFPPGVVNVVPGYGETAGAYLARHPGVGKVAFTGSTAVGRTIAGASAANLARVQLELGGKGPNLIFPDADLDAALAGSLYAAFHNAGQACIAGSRILVHTDVAEVFTDALIQRAAALRVGDPRDPATEIGPLVSHEHRERVLTYVELARKEGAAILSGGRPPDDPALRAGAYVLPTVIHAAPSHRVCQEEIFGPVVTVTPFTDDAEAVELANALDYGLGAGLWTRDLSRAHTLASELATGMVWVNTYKRVAPGVPFGGVKASGYGSDLGFDAVREYTRAKSVWVRTAAGYPPFFTGGPSA